MQRRSHLCGALGLAMLCLPAASAQVLELSGGDSTLYQSGGASLKLHSTSFDSGISGGMEEGRFLMGGYVRHVTESATYTAGMQDLNLSLPTDIFSGDHHLATVGVGVEATHREDSGTTRIRAFGGASSQRLESPFVQGFSQLAPTAALLLERTITPHVTLRTQLLASSNVTSLESVEWKPSLKFKVALAAGFGGTSHYGAASVVVRRPQVDLDAAYVSTGRNFHRTGSQPDLTAEFVRENVSCTLRPAVAPGLTLTVERQNFLIPPTQNTGYSAAISTLSELTASERIRALHLSGSVFHTSYLGEGNLAYALSATLPATRRLTLEASFYGSRLLAQGSSSNTSVVTTVREKVTPRLSLSQTINHSGGSTTAGLGGSLLSNLATISLDYQTVYLPARPQDPFQQTLMLDVQINVFGRLLAHAGTMVSPLGKLLYTADARAVQAVDHGASLPAQHTRLGNSVLHARVVDEAGSPVAGAAIEIDGNLGFTDSDGNFFLRESKPKLHTYRLALDQFLDGLEYRVVSQPLAIGSSRASLAPAVIVVTRRPR